MTVEHLRNAKELIEKLVESDIETFKIQYLEPEKESLA
jgi:hypothetical protein